MTRTLRLSRLPSTGAIALRIGLLLALVVLSRAQGSSAQQASSPQQPDLSGAHAARGYGLDSARVDSQITLKIPTAEADAVYEYLKTKYVGQQDILAELLPGHHLNGQKMSDLSIFTDKYFDTPTLQLHANKNSVRHRSRVNTTNPDDRKSGRELVQVKVTPAGNFTLRNELKYQVDEAHNAPGQGRETHPLIRLISARLRANFKQVFVDASIDPYALKHVFTIVQTRRRGYVNWDDKNIFSFSVDQGSAHYLWAKGSFSSVDLGLVEIVYTEADPEQREQMWHVRDAIVQDLMTRFPNLQQNSDSKYSIVLDQLEAQIPWIPLILRSGLRPGEALMFAFVLVTLALFVIVAGLRRFKPARSTGMPDGAARSAAQRA